MSAYIVWVPSLIFLGCIFAAISRHVNHNPSSWMLWLLLLPNPIWLVVTKVSKNIIFDGFVYDTVILLAYTVTFLVLGEGQNFNWINYLGIFFTVLGLICLRVV